MRDIKVPSQRHPEKAHRVDNPQPKKPNWIRVKAPTSEGYKKLEIECVIIPCYRFRRSRLP